MISGAIISANIKRERVADMGKYEYNFVEVPFDGDLKSGNAETIEKCKDIIRKESAQGWRLVQIISPSSEKRVLTSNSNYAIVLKGKTELFSLFDCVNSFRDSGSANIKQIKFTHFP